MTEDCGPEFSGPIAVGTGRQDINNESESHTGCFLNEITAVTF